MRLTVLALFSCPCWLQSDCSENPFLQVPISVFSWPYSVSYASIYHIASETEINHQLDTPMNQPNIILFMVDQLSSFVLNTYGGTVCQTPNIDALAQRGTVFEHAYCPYPHHVLVPTTMAPNCPQQLPPLPIICGAQATTLAYRGRCTLLAPINTMVLKSA